MWSVDDLSSSNLDARILHDSIKGVIHLLE